MSLVLLYAVLAVFVPAFWLGARLWALRDSNRVRAHAPSAQVIHFPGDYRRCRRASNAVADAANRRSWGPRHLE